MAKRVFDLFLSMMGIIVMLPLYLIICLFVKLGSKGPIFFVQKRIGRHGDIFILYKFRSMTVSAVAKEGQFDAGDTSRVTRVGRILRKWKLDELPQLINVLKGDMSFVGPRPEILKWTLIYQEQWAVVHKVRPGITDSAAILFRNEEELLAASEDPERLYKDVILPRKLAIYIDYVNNNSLISDLLLILKTLRSL